MERKTLQLLIALDNMKKKSVSTKVPFPVQARFPKENAQVAMYHKKKGKK